MSEMNLRSQATDQNPTSHRNKIQPAQQRIQNATIGGTDLSLELQGKGRVLLRYSGTEPKIRLLIEGRDQASIDHHADRIAAALQAAIGDS